MLAVTWLQYGPVDEDLLLWVEVGRAWSSSVAWSLQLVGGCVHDTFVSVLKAIRLHVHVALISITFFPVPVTFIHDVTVLAVNACCRSQLVDERLPKFLLDRMF